MRRLSFLIAIALLMVSFGVLGGNLRTQNVADAQGGLTSSPASPGGTIDNMNTNLGTSVNGPQLTIQNPAGNTETVEITGISAESSEFTVNPAVGDLMLEPGTNLPINISCLPVTTYGERTTPLTINYNGSTSGAGFFQYTLKCFGFSPGATFNPSPNTTFTFVNVTSGTDSPGQDIVITNAGNGSNNLTGTAQIINNVAGVFEFTDNTTTMNFSIVGGINATTNVGVRCSPPVTASNATNYTAKVRITHNGLVPPGAHGTPSDFPLSCTTRAATYSAGFPAVNGTFTYPTTTLGDTSDGSISFRNIGDAPLTVSNPVLSNPTDFILNVGTVPTGQIPKTSNVNDPNADLNFILITCNPQGTSLAPRTSTFSMNTNDPQRPTVTYNLSCPVNAPEYNAQLNGSNLAGGGTIDFGIVFAGGTQTRSITIQNLANNGATLIVTNIGLTGANAAQFALNAPASFPVEIAPGGSQIATIQCNTNAGDAAMTYSATLTVNNNDVDEGAIQYNLTCDPALPGFSETPDPVVFSPDPTFPGGVTKETFTITNTGGAQLAITNALFTGSEAGNFLFTLTPPQQANNATWFIINPGASKDVEIQCKANTQGVMDGHLVLTTNDPANSEVTIDLTCTGFAASGYSSVPTPASVIDIVTTPGTPKTATVVITNTGVGAFTINTVGFTAASAIMTATQTGGDAIVNGTPSGDSATVTITCTSGINATETRTLRITHTSTGSPADYTVNCTVAAPTPNYVTTTAPANITTSQGQGGNTTTLQISNSGTATLNITSIAFTNPKFTSNFPGGGDTIAVGANKTYTITCDNSTTAGSPFATTVTVNHDDVTAPPTNPTTYNITCTVNPFAPIYNTVTAPPNITTSQFAGAPNNRTRLVFENTGNAPLNITSVTLGTNPGNRFSRVSALPTNVAGGGTDAFIDFACDTATTTVGPVSTTITVNHNAAGSPATYTIECTVGAAQAGYGSNPAFSTTATPTTINFPEAVEGGADTTFTFVITETGNADLVVSDIQFTGSNFSIQPAFPLTGATIPNNSNSSLSLTLVCDASAANTYTETMTVFHNGTNTPTPGETVYTVFCNVQDLVPAYGSNPNPGSTITVNTSVGATGGNTATFTIFESGTGPLNISSITPGGVNPSKFTVTTSRGNAPFTIADAEGPVTITVACDPSVAGAFNATLAIGHSGETGNATPANYNLACNVAPPSPEYTAAPASLTFNDVIFGTTSASQAITVTNAGGAPLTVSAILTGGQNTQFAFSGYTAGTNQTVAAGASFPFNITCTPTASAASRTTNLQVTHNDPAGTVVTYPIACNAISAPSPSLNVEPGSLEYTGTSNSTVGQTKSISITNGVSGSAPLNWVVSESLSWLVCSPTSGTTTNETDTVNCTATPGSLTSSSSPLSGIVTVTTTGLSPTQTDTVNVTFTITDPAPKFESEPTAGSTLTINTTPSVAGTTNVKIKNTGNATLSGITVRLSNTSMTQFSITNGSGITSLAAATESTITVQCVSSTLTTLNNTLEVLYTQGGSQQTASFPIVCNVTTTGAATGTTGGTTGGTGTGTPGVTQCPANQVFSKPFPQNASGEFLMVNCFLVTGPGTFNLPLTQVLTTPMSTVTQTNIATIQANPGLMSVWRMGSWFLVPSSYNAANATYSFDAIAGTQIYAFFYGAITQPVGAQGNPTTTTTTSGGVAPGTATGNVPDAITELPQPRDNRPRAILISVGVTLLLGVAFMAITDRRKARRRTEI